MEEHVTKLEFLMYARSKKNPKFAMQLAELDNFPVFFEVPLLPPMPPMGMPMGEDHKELVKG